MAVLLGPNLTLAGTAPGGEPVNRDTWEHLQSGKPPYSTVLHWPWLRPLRVDSLIKRCVFFCFWDIIIVHSQLINTMHHFHLGMNITVLPYYPYCPCPNNF